MSRPRTLSRLRDLMPLRPLSHSEALRLAELQAARLLALTGTTVGPVPEGVISELAGIEVRYTTHLDSPVSGLCKWHQGRYLILIDGTEPTTRQRFSLAHEFKHALDYPFAATLYPGPDSREQQELVCDYFAACLLMPKTWVKQAWCNDRLQELSRLARRFAVSTAAMRVRLDHLGLIEPARRCGVAA